MHKQQRLQKGFTLIEIAIVLVIIGLLLGGVLKGQELIIAAKVRNLAAELDGIKVAYLGFQDRFRVLPGDMATAAANASIPGTPATPGCTGGVACGNGRIDADEVFLVWQHLSRSGFITGSYTGTIADTVPTAANNPTNPFGGYLQMINDTIYDDAAEPAQAIALNVKTGGLIPPGVAAEVDRKIDDGAPLTGVFRSAGNVARTTTLVGGVTVAACDTAAAPVQWNAAAELKNCAGVALQ
jgi:prepilin-type N-terminal cleavage/methylation domain-containing protein